MSSVGLAVARVLMWPLRKFPRLYVLNCASGLDLNDCCLSKLSRFHVDIVLFSVY